MRLNVVYVINTFSRLIYVIGSCCTQDIKDGKEETVDELLLVLQKLMK